MQQPSPALCAAGLCFFYNSENVVLAAISSGRAGLTTVMIINNPRDCQQFGKYDNVCFFFTNNRMWEGPLILETTNPHRKPSYCDVEAQ